MIRLIVLATMFLPAAALAEEFQRPIPQAQSATAEGWYFAASVTLLLFLLAVHMLVRRR